MTAAKLDPALCRELASLFKNRGPLASIDRDWPAIAEQLLAAADLAERPALTEELVYKVVRAAIAQHFGGEVVGIIAARAAKELAGAVVGLSERDQEILSVLIDDVQAFGAGDEDDRKDERFQRDTLSLLRRLKRDVAPLAAAFDSTARAIAGQSAAALTEQLTEQLKPDTANIGPADTAVIDEALEYTAARKPGAPIADIARIRAALTSGGGS